MSYLELNVPNDLLKLSMEEDNGRKYLRIPVAKIGKWKHSVYGEVKFSQEDFDDLTSNFDKGKAGFDPPLFLGHPISTNSMEGHPSEGWPDKLYQEGDLMYAEYTPTDESLFSDVQKKRYRYASAEIIRNATDKESGEKIGSLLVGLALTNRPFLPFKNHEVKAVVEKFSDSSVNGPLTVFSFDLDPETENTSMTTSNPETQVLSAPEVEVPQSAPAVDTVPKEKYDKLAEDFSTLAKEFSSMKQQFSALMEVENNRVIEAKLEKLRGLNLPESTKQTFSDMIRSNSLSEAAEQSLFSDYQQLSDQYKHVFSQNQGSQDVTTPVGNEVEMPEYYSNIIERNRKIAEARSLANAPQLL